MVYNVIICNVKDNKITFKIPRRLELWVVRSNPTRVYGGSKKLFKIARTGEQARDHLLFSFIFSLLFL
jgi:hypothetical protein